MIIKQIIVVEGKSDTIKLKNIFGIDNVETIETNGLSLNNYTLELIKKINETRGVIIFTDPDGPGSRIRDKINSYLDNDCINAFIDKKNLVNTKKIGIAEANEEDIKYALKNLLKFKNKITKNISWQDYLNYEIYKKENRIKIAKIFNWDESINAKKLFKWINLIDINIDKLKKIIGE
ncbi:ribonuclease M5 [Spiroplasma gladiatoris]|uniref:Ribonuclease M5 n=1 Tax=Spiroplasma gladiatoris TaxID=2143 RepID=A0A4P7AIW5_9MOLU|nr:ribonuclease M5 [Spiroplasma gladiatoris]QBQ08212.1 ribonuclease M5 [Spiroplasma gladiatoris]